MTIRVVKKRAYNFYRVMRSVLFTTVITVALLYVSLYVFLSIPPVQNYIRERAERELTAFLGGDVKINKVDIFPFNEVRLKEIEFYTPTGDKCISIGTLGAGIRLWRLIRDRKIEITYAEIVELNGKVWQQEKDGPLNIAYIIEALSPKNKNKPATLFDLRINNVVIRQSTLSFDRLWAKGAKMGDSEMSEERYFDPNHLMITELRADVTLPRIKNDDFTIDLRRLAFKSYSDFEVRKLSLKAHITNKQLSVKDFILLVGNSEFTLGDLSIYYPSFDKIGDALKRGDNSINLNGKNISPREFRFFYPSLSNFEGRYDLILKATGNPDNISVERFGFNRKGDETRIDLSGEVRHLQDSHLFTADLYSFKCILPSDFTGMIFSLPPLNKSIDNKLVAFISRIGDVEMNLKGEYSKGGGKIITTGDVKTSLGALSFDIDGITAGKKQFAGNFELNTESLDIGRLFDNSALGDIAFSTSGSVEYRDKVLDGSADLIVNYIDYNGYRFSDITIAGEKRGNLVKGDVNVNDPLADLTLSGEAMLADINSHLILSGEIDNIYPSIFGVLPKYNGYSGKANIDAELTGSNLDNVTGHINIGDLSFVNSGGDGINLNTLSVVSGFVDNSLSDDRKKTERKIDLATDFLTASIIGNFKVNELLPGIKSLLSDNVSSIINAPSYKGRYDSYADINVEIFAEDRLPDFLHLPVKPLKEILLRGRVDLQTGLLECELNAPYLLQGTNKLISNTHLYGIVEQDKGATINVITTYPIKNDRAKLEANITALDDSSHINIGWSMVNNPSASGKISMDGRVFKDITTGSTDVNLSVNPSEFSIGASEWRIDESNLSYSQKRVSVDNLRIWHDKQFVEINGIASADPEDEMNIRLADIDLEYIFGILNINYVTFGGIATGELTASSVFTKNPVAHTKQLLVDDFSYNNAVLGNADIYSCWNNEEKEVEIHADIKEEGVGGAKVDGGIFLTRDSLSFDMKADKINISFLKPFMSAFTSDVGGRASGDVKLFGTFKDIDLTGRAYADSIYMKVDYTNVYYHGSDSVILNPGHIIIPSFRLLDRYGNSALLSGYVKHSYFHDPEFEFKLNNAKKLLCYETNSAINPDWYGTIFASGKGTLRGRPGIVAIEMDMTTDDKSDFTFVLSDTQTALDYTFLTFSDRKKAQSEEEVEIEETFEEKFMKKKVEEVTTPSLFTMDLRATVTPEAKMNLIMDPNAGDKIVARGGGPLQIHYDTESDEMSMYGKYTLTEGNYNFSLQELILRDFKIREGSSISFNGDPLLANIDILASYRVNTNLSDLDKSFATDRDLNRTNVPVDALLKVKGDLQSPDISFDISLPTLTSDVERKVRSIISTEDLMSRQIIYLLALNRFYTPEYMGSSSSGGGELASVASSTLSSQLSNIMGQLTDKFTLSPSFRSDKGDFSDMEVDVSLSSSLLNNRLLVNGNFGYRDRSTSQTTFVGDFDIEYLLSKNGNLRLKAYNHFNDQNYYLKSSLTTQGLGVVYRKEFDNPFTWLRRKKRNIPEDNEKKQDSDSTKNRSDAYKSESSSIVSEEDDN